MDIKCIDVAFGEMTYKHRWFKKQEINIFGQKKEIVIAAKAYLKKEITEKQQESYRYFCKNEEKIIKIIEEELKSYINTNLLELAKSWIGARRINFNNDLNGITEAKTLLFKQDGTIILLLNCVWDEEHGIGVKIYPEVEVGSQDLFL